jgi:hypothetical protein
VKRIEPFVPLPVAMLDDTRLEAIHVRAYGVLLAIDVDRDGRSLISLTRLGRRIGRDARSAERIVCKLEETGWLKTIDPGNGRCRSYDLLTPVTNRHGTPDTNRHGTPDTDIQGTLSTGDGQPCLSVTETLYTGRHQPIINPESFPEKRIFEKDGRRPTHAERGRSAAEKYRIAQGLPTQEEIDAAHKAGRL